MGKVDVENGNGNHDLTAVATLEDRLELTPEEMLPAVRLEAMTPKSDRLAEIVKLLLQELGMDIENQHFRETPERVARFYRSEEHTSELQSRSDLVCRLLLEKKK